MDFVRDVLLFLHLLGMASLLGGALVQLRDETQVVNSAMLHGALTQVVTGLLLVGVIEGQNDPLDHTKVGVKLAVALVITVLCWVNRRKDAVPRGLFMGILLLTVGNVGVAVFW
ncbi:MAG: hypothetical protein WAK18_07440 [Nocardioidaceae bacterium]